MGAVHGKGRFRCEDCMQSFSWRLDLAGHIKHCSANSSRLFRRSKNNFLLESCFFCGCQLSDILSEEASFIKCDQKLYNSKRLLKEILQVILSDKVIVLNALNTIGLCQECMTTLNRWDAMDQELAALTKSLRTTYCMKEDRSCTQFRNECHVIGKEPLENLNKLKVNNEEIAKDTCKVNCEINDYCSPLIKQEENNQLQEIITTQQDMNYACECGKKIHGLNALVNHVLKNGCRMKITKHGCNNCSSVFSERKQLIVHKKQCLENSKINGTHGCDLCGRRFLVRGRLETHKRKVHSIGTVDQQLCCYCGHVFGSSYNMNNHLARSHGIGQVEEVVCKLCGRSYSDQSSLRNHIKSIHGEKIYGCTFCEKKFTTRGLRNQHVNEVHNNTYSYECKICYEKFHSSCKYRYHMTKMHNTIQYACEDCGRNFLMKSDLYRHMRGVHMGIRCPKKYPCKTCGRMFPSMYKIQSSSPRLPFLGVWPSCYRKHPWKGSPIYIKE